MTGGSSNTTKGSWNMIMISSSLPEEIITDTTGQDKRMRMRRMTMTTGYIVKLSGTDRHLLFS